MNAPKTQNTTEVTLIKGGHTHAGKARKQGDKIHVTAAERTWLAKHGLVEADSKGDK